MYISRKEALQYPPETEMEAKERQEAPQNIVRLKKHLMTAEEQNKIWCVGINPPIGKNDPQAVVSPLDKFKFGVGYPDEYDLSFLVGDRIFDGYIKASFGDSNQSEYDIAREINAKIAKRNIFLNGDDIQRVAWLKFPSADPLIKELAKQGKRWDEAGTVVTRMLGRLFRANQEFSLQYTVRGLDIELSVRYAKLYALSDSTQDSSMNTGVIEDRPLRIYREAKDEYNRAVTGPVRSFIDLFETHFLK